MNRKLIVPILIMLSLAGAAFPQKAATDAEAARKILAGDWKVNGKEVYESWSVDGQNFFGRGYRMKNGVENVTERLEVREIDGAVYYLATVANQNNGATIRFKLMESTSEKLRFENPEHDFPKKLIYSKSGPDELTVNVLGAGDNGFTLVMSRLKSTAKP